MEIKTEIKVEENKLTCDKLMNSPSSTIWPYFAIVGKQRHVVRYFFPIVIDRVGPKYYKIMDKTLSHEPHAVFPEMDIPKEKFNAFWLVWLHLNSSNEYANTSAPLLDKLKSHEYIQAFDIDDPTTPFYDTYIDDVHFSVDREMILNPNSELDVADWCRQVSKHEIHSRVSQDVMRMASGQPSMLIKDGRRIC